MPGEIWRILWLDGLFVLFPEFFIMSYLLFIHYFKLFLLLRLEFHICQISWQITLGLTDGLFILSHKQRSRVRKWNFDELLSIIRSWCITRESNKIKCFEKIRSLVNTFRLNDDATYASLGIITRLTNTFRNSQNFIVRR